MGYSNKVVRALSEIIRIQLRLTYPVSDKFIALISSLMMGKNKHLPPIRDKILLMSATEMAKKIRKRQLKSEDVVKAYIERSRLIHPFINAVVDERYEAALKEARDVDKYLDTSKVSCDELARTSPLLGIPFSCKESIGVKGIFDANHVFLSGRTFDRKWVVFHVTRGEIWKTPKCLSRQMCLYTTENQHPSPFVIQWLPSNLGLTIPKSEVLSLGYDMVQTCGILRAKDRIAVRDAKVVELYKMAGAIPLLVTNVPEFCMWFTTNNLIFGKTNNPYDHRRIVGGSSGGEGAVISAAGSVMGIGTDLAGSMRLPASFCGIYAHKATPRLISNERMFPGRESERQKLYDFSSIGPMCRYAEDIPLLFKVLLGSDKSVDMNKKIDFRNVKIYYMETLPGFSNSSTYEIRKTMRKAVNHFENNYGSKPIVLKMNEFKYAMNMWECKLLGQNTLPTKLALGENGEAAHLGWELCKYLFGTCHHTLSSIYYATIEKREKDFFYQKILKCYEQLLQRLNKTFEEEAVLLLPTFPEPPPLQLVSLTQFSKLGYTSVFNVLGLPVTQVPAGISAALPIGIQVISGRLKDHLTIATALELDKVFGGWKSPCSIKS